MKKVTKADLDAYIRRARGLIAEHGWVVQYIGPGLPGSGARRNDPPYAYSVGLSKAFNHPEIYLVGLPYETSVSVINEAGKRIKDGARFDGACYSDVIVQQFPVAFMPIEKRSVIAHSAAGRNILGNVFQGIQMIVPDATGRFPWDEGCDRDMASVQMSLLDVVGDPPSLGIRVPMIQ